MGQQYLYLIHLNSSIAYTVSHVKDVSDQARSGGSPWRTIGSPKFPITVILCILFISYVTSVSQWIDELLNTLWAWV